MTRFLSQALKAPEPAFRQGLQRLEAANGHHSSDIRLSNDVRQATKAKLQELGLDPRDTAPEELYQALMTRIKGDDALLVKNLRTRAARHVSAEARAEDGLVMTLKSAAAQQDCFALKATVLKSLFKKLPPKKAMKALGYRSLESFLKHEPPGSALAAAWLAEGISWQAHLLDQYKKLKPGDFEIRPLAILEPKGKHWLTLANQTVQRYHHNFISFKELATLVVLPFGDHIPEGAITASLALGLHEINEIKSCSTYLKLSQVRPQFGSIVKTVANEQPTLNSKLLDQPVSWHLIQQFYARASDRFKAAIFEPHVQAEDMSWKSVTAALAELEPRFSFWHGSDHLGLLEGSHLVSLNLLDSAINYCNHLPFEGRVAHYFRHSLMSELMLKYLQHGQVEASVVAELQPDLALETVQT